METAFSQRLDSPAKRIEPFWAMPFGLAGHPGHCGWLVLDTWTLDVWLSNSYFVSGLNHFGLAGHPG
jgi:hypothetical protein